MKGTVAFPAIASQFLRSCVYDQDARFSFSRTLVEALRRAQERAGPHRGAAVADAARWRGAAAQSHLSIDDAQPRPRPDRRSLQQRNGDDLRGEEVDVRRA